MKRIQSIANSLNNESSAVIFLEIKDFTEIKEELTSYNESQQQPNYGVFDNEKGLKEGYFSVMIDGKTIHFNTITRLMEQLTSVSQKQNQ